MKPSVVVPINDERESDALVRQAVDHYRRDGVQVHVLNVQRPLPMHIAQFFGRDELAQVHREAGMKVLERSLRMLDDARVPYEAHVLVGKPAETIVRFAESHGCGEILMDGPSPGLLSRLGIGSIASQVRHLMASHAADSATPEATTR